MVKMGLLDWLLAYLRKGWGEGGGLLVYWLEEPWWIWWGQPGVLIEFSPMYGMNEESSWLIKWWEWRRVPLNLRPLLSTGQVWSSSKIKWGELFIGGCGKEGVIDKPNGGNHADSKPMCCWSILPSDSHLWFWGQRESPIHRVELSSSHRAQCHSQLVLQC